MKIQQCSYVDVANAIAIGEHKSLTFQPTPETKQPSPCQGMQSGINQIESPFFAFNVFTCDHSPSEVHREISVEVESLQEIILDELTHVAKRNVEIITSIAGVMFHDVPKNRFAADLHHRLGAK